MERPYLEKFLDFHTISMKSKNTIIHYRDSLLRFYEMFPNKKCEEIDIPEIKQFIVKYSTVWKRNTMVNRLIALKLFYAWLLKEKYIEANVFENVPLPKKNETPVEIVTQGELDKMDAVADDLETPFLSRVLYWLIKDTGLRREEVGKVLLTDLNLKDNLLYVRDTKGKVVKLNAFSEKTATLIKQWLATSPDPNNLLVFTTRTGTPYLGRYVYRMIEMIFIRAFGKKWAKKSGPHLLRHIAATQWVANGGDTTSLQWMMGWKSESQAQRYVHQNPAMIKRKFKEVHKNKNGIS